MLGNEQNNCNVTSSASSTLGNTQSMGNGALNSIHSGGVNNIREWFKNCMAKPLLPWVGLSVQVGLHLDYEITIDCEPK